MHAWSRAPLTCVDVSSAGAAQAAFNFFNVAIQQSGSSYLLSLLKRASSGVVRMLSASFMTGSIVRRARCNIFVSVQLIGWSFTCGKVYIGETKRWLETCLKEHKDACTKCLTDKSAIVEHAWADDHPITWAETKTLQRARRTMELAMKEALSIRTTPEDARFNRDSGYELPDCWIATFKKLKGGTSLSSARRRHAHAGARGARPGMRTN